MMRWLIRGREQSGPRLSSQGVESRDTRWCCMKFKLCVGLLAIILFGCHSVQKSPPAKSASAKGAPATSESSSSSSADLGVRVKERGPHNQQIEYLTISLDATGNTVTNLHSITVLGTGLNY